MKCCKVVFFGIDKQGGHVVVQEGPQVATYDITCEVLLINASKSYIPLSLEEGEELGNADADEGRHLRVLEVRVDLAH